MSNFSKTISYLKRNGIKSTCYEVAERLDKTNLEEIQKKAAAYKGNRYFCDEKVWLMYAAGDDLRHIPLNKLPDKPRFQKDFVFSILVPAYETNPRYLKEMLDSVIAQSEFAKVELIVADAGKSDRVEQVVKAYSRRLEETKETLARLLDRKEEKKRQKKRKQSGSTPSSNISA